MTAQPTLWQRLMPAIVPREGVAMMQGTALLLRGVLIAQFIGLGAMPILTRWFSVEAFGQFQTYLAIINVALVGASLRYEFAILTARNRGEVNSLVQLCFLIVLGVAALFGLIMAGVMRWPALVDTSDWRFDGTLLAAGIVVGGTYQVLGYVVTRFAAYRQGGNARVIMASANCGSSLIIGGIKPIATGIIFGDIIGKAVAGFWLIFVAFRHGVHIWPPVSLRRLKAVARRYGNFAFVSVSSSLVGAVSGAIAPLMILTTFGTELTGQFGLVERTLTLVINVATISMAQVYTNRLAEQFRQREYEDALSLFRRTAGLLALAMLLPTVILAATAPTIFKIIFGLKWEVAGRFAQIMAFWYYINVIQGVFIYALFTLHKQKLQFLWEISRLFTLIFLWVVIRQAGLEPMAALALHYAVLFAFSAVFLWLLYRVLKGAARNSEALSRASRSHKDPVFVGTQEKDDSGSHTLP